MFIVDQAAVRYINQQSGSIVISLKLEPAMGGCACSTQHITGSYLPVIALGPPNDSDQFNQITVDGITIFYAANIQPKADCSHIAVKLKRVLFWSWLEVEGAKAIASFK